MKVFSIFSRVFFISVLSNGSTYCQEFEVREESTELVQRATSYGKTLIDDFKIGMESYASIVEARFHTSPDSSRVFESKARFERFEDKGLVWMKNTWKTETIEDERSERSKTTNLPSYKNCSSEIVIVKSRVFEVVETKNLGVDGKTMPPKLHKRRPMELVCGSGVSTKDWPFAYTTCFSVRFACNDLLEATFGPHSRCLSAKEQGKKLESIWVGAASSPGRVKAVERIVFDDELPVEFEIRFSQPGFSTRPGQLKIDKGELIAKSKTKWKKFDVFSVPEKVEAIYYDRNGDDGFKEMYVDANIKFFPAESKEFLNAKGSMEKLAERATKLEASSSEQEQ